MMALSILGDRIMLKVDEAQTTEGGIFLPQSAQKKSQHAIVLAVGQGKRLEDGSFAPIDLKVGDKVVFAKYGGTEVTVDGEDYLIMDCSYVYAKGCK